MECVYPMLSVYGFYHHFVFLNIQHIVKKATLISNMFRYSLPMNNMTDLITLS